MSSLLEPRPRHTMLVCEVFDLIIIAVLVGDLTPIEKPPSLQIPLSLLTKLLYEISLTGDTKPIDDL